MSDPIERIIRVHRTDRGHPVLTATVTDTGGLMPIRLTAGIGQSVHMTWSDWAEVCDHVEGCRPRALEVNVPDPDGPGSSYVECGEPHHQGTDAPRCVLAMGHLLIPGRDKAHVDMYGERW
jgi:hypothetical protein